MTFVSRFDARKLGKAERTPQGFARVDAHLARVGIQLYRRADGSVQRELRHPDDVFAAESLASAGAAPVTIGHVGTITPANVRTHRVGGVVGEAKPSGGFVAAKVQVEDAQALADVDAGKLVEISVGYETEYDPTPGVWEGQPYDGRQTKITFNHIALLPAGAGRGGPHVSLRLDSAEAVLDETDNPLLQEKHGIMKIKVGTQEFDVPDQVGAELTTVRASLATAEKAQATAEVKATDAQARADALLSPEAITKLVAARQALETGAKRILGGDFTIGNKTEREVHEAVVAKARPNMVAELPKKSAAFVEGLFTALVDAAGEAVAAVAAGAAAVGSVVAEIKTPEVVGVPRTDATDDDPDVIYAKACAERASAYKRAAK